MQTNNERIRDVWESTQDNLETAVGQAYSSYTNFHNHYLLPSVDKLSSIPSSSLFSCCPICCLGRRKSHKKNIRRNSVDIFFDMYDDEDAFGHDELERLLNSDVSPNNNNNINNDDGINYGSSNLFVSVPAKHTSNRPGNFIIKLPSVIKNWWFNKPVRLDTDHDCTTSMSTSDYPRVRSSTKSSTTSNGSSTSSSNLFGDSMIEDAQPVTDLITQSLVYRNSASFSSILEEDESDDDDDDDQISHAVSSSTDLYKDGVGTSSNNNSKTHDKPRRRANSASSISTVSSRTNLILTQTDDELREEELRVEREEEEEIINKRKAAEVLKKQLQEQQHQQKQLEMKIKPITSSTSLSTLELDPKITTSSSELAPNPNSDSNLITTPKEDDSHIQSTSR